MNLIRKFFLISSIVSFIFILFISLLNLDHKIKLKLLIWETPKLHTGSFIAIGGTLGFITSFSIVFSANNKNIPLRSTRKYNQSEEFLNHYNHSNNYTNNSSEEFKSSAELQINQYLDRDLRDPLPTISVPYRIIKNSLQSDNNNFSESELELDDSYQEVNNSNLNSNDSNDWNDFDNENW